jgi:sigma-B regulation protein RsbU (phosphoserine phosphatase)
VAAPKLRLETTGFVTAMAVAGTITIISGELGRTREIVGLYAMVPLIAAIFCGPLLTLISGIVAIGSAVSVGAYLHQNLVAAQAIRLGGIGFSVLVGTLGAILRTRENRQLAEVQEVAEVSQETVLRRLPPRVGDVALAVRYRSANKAARIGGDLYEALQTPFGVRLLVGDVRGKGLEAVTTASAVLQSFREAAHLEADLAQVALRMDASMRRDADDEEFVTAVIVEVSNPNVVLVVDCGHHPPIVATEDSRRFAHVAAGGQPLGVGRSWSVSGIPFGQGDRMLLYTDGLVEARDRAGQPFPLLERSQECMAAGSLDECLDLLLRRLRRHVRRRFKDDLALMILQRAKVRSPALEELAAKPE